MGFILIIIIINIYIIIIITTIVMVINFLYTQAINDFFKEYLLAEHLLLPYWFAVAVAVVVLIINQHFRK